MMILQLNPHCCNGFPVFINITIFQCHLLGNYLELSAENAGNKQPCKTNMVSGGVSGYHWFVQQTAKLKENKKMWT